MSLGGPDIPPQRRHELVDQPEQCERSSKNGQCTEYALLKSLKAVWNDRDVVVHVARERQGKCLATNYNVPTHHKYAEQHEQQCQYSAFNRQARQYQ